MTTPTNIEFVDQTTVITEAWLDGVNDWVYGSYGVLGETFTASAFRTSLAVNSTNELQLQSSQAFTTGGTSTAYTLTPSPAIAANAVNLRFRVNFHTAAGSTPTLAVSGKTALNLKYKDGTGTKQAVTSSQVPSGWISDVENDGTDWVVLQPANVALLSGATFTGTINTARSTVASAATTADIWAANNQIDWTGTTTCTGFPAAPQAGASRRLICAAAAPFTAGANMLIDGTASGSTVTLEANDIVDVEAVTTTQFRLRITKYTGRGVGNGSKAGTTTRDLTAASGNQTITGSPFRPTRVYIQASIDGSRQNSDGWSDGTTNTCYKIDYTATVDGLSTTTCVFIRTAVGDYQTGTISFTSDGFTIAWNKVGSPTGTANIAYMMEA